MGRRRGAVDGGCGERIGVPSGEGRTYLWFGYQSCFLSILTLYSRMAFLVISLLNAIERVIGVIDVGRDHPS